MTDSKELNIQDIDIFVHGTFSHPFRLSLSSSWRPEGVLLLLSVVCMLPCCSISNLKGPSCSLVVLRVTVCWGSLDVWLLRSDVFARFTGFLFPFFLLLFLTSRLRSFFYSFWVCLTMLLVL